MKQKTLLALCLIPFLSMLFSGLALKELSRPLAEITPQLLVVQRGDSASSVASELQRRGIFDYPKLWLGYGRLFDMARRIKAGEYQITPTMSALEILDRMVKGDVVSYTVTLIEGWTAREAINAIQKSQGVVKTQNADDMQVWLNVLAVDSKYTHLEGLLYPDTYQYIAGTKDSEILQRSYQRLIKVLEEEWQSRAKNLPYSSAYEALIMASIIEKETAAEEEREQIAGVFVERLYQGMRLQTDPTVIYGMGDNYDGNIRRKDLRKPTAYNTYTMHGLPPTPIALPAQASIAAALHPLLNGKIYFVAKGNGYHQFSYDLVSHEQAVHKYQIKRKADYRTVQ